MVIVKFFEKSAFDSNWHHGQDASCLIIGRELNREQLAQIKNLNFDYVDFEKNIFHTIAKRIQKKQIFSFSYSDEYLISSGEDLVCKKAEFDDLDLVLSLKNIKTRSKAVFQIRQHVLEKYGTYFTYSSLTGTHRFWNGFSSFHNQLIATNQVDPNNYYDDFVLNFYLSFHKNLVVKGI